MNLKRSAERLCSVWRRTRSGRAGKHASIAVLSHGMTINQLDDYLKQHWPAIQEQLLSGTYRPEPVKRVEIPKPDGGLRRLGIPTVLDRFIQQAVMQVLLQ
jgi:RNA-directed DNA polymerase